MENPGNTWKDVFLSSSHMTFSTDVPTPRGQVRRGIGRELGEPK